MKSWLALLFVLLVATCAATSGAASSRHVSSALAPDAGGPSGPSARAGPSAKIPPAAPVALRQTPRWLLGFCRKNWLLRPLCPRRLPSWGTARPGFGQQLYTCADRRGHQPVGGRSLVALFESRRCVNAVWGYENGEFVPGYVGGGSTALSGWNGMQWIPLAGPSLLFSPPFHVHIEIAAAVGSYPGFGLGVRWPEGAHRITDALLDPRRAHAVSLGWVRWYGKYGQLLLQPIYPLGGEWGGHLIFYVPPHGAGISYAVTLHAWMPALRLDKHGGARVFRFQPGPALPHVIATLRAIVGSALSS